MHKKHLKLLGGLILVGILSACTNSSSQPIDPAQVEVLLTTEPTPVQISKKVTLTAQVAGVGQ